MGLVATLIIYGALAAGLITAAWAAVAHVEGIGAKKVEAKYEPLITQCTTEGVSPLLCATEWIQALIENKKQGSVIRDLTQGAQACSAETSRMEKETLRNDSAKTQRLTKAQVQIDELEIDKKLAIQFASTPRPAGETCETTLKKADIRLRGIAARELRDRSAEAIRDGPGGSNSQNPSDSSMRITK